MRNTPYGKRHSKKTKMKMRQAAHKRKLRGPWCSEETKRKISVANKGHAAWNKDKKTGKLSQEHREKLSLTRKGPKNPRWKGGKMRSTGGYIYILCPHHPHATKLGYVRRSRLVMEAHIGRYLKPDEVVHHINGIVDDDRIENLMLFANEKEHMRHHVPKGSHKGRGNPMYGKHHKEMKI